jgi:hypothetical protein
LTTRASINKAFHIRLDLILEILCFPQMEDLELCYRGLSPAKATYSRAFLTFGISTKNMISVKNPTPLICVEDHLQSIFNQIFRHIQNL